MNIFTVRFEIPRIPYAVIGKPSLPDFFRAPKLSSELVRISTFDELHSAV